MNKKIMAGLLSLCLIFGSAGIYRAETRETQNITTEKSGSAYVGYQKKSTYLVTIPKSIYFSENKSVEYGIVVTGDIAANERIKVEPKNGVEAKKDGGVYITMEDISNADDGTHQDYKADVIATITQQDTEWTRKECLTTGGVTKKGTITAENLTAGEWGGILTFQITLLNKAIP